LFSLNSTLSANRQAKEVLASEMVKSGYYNACTIGETDLAVKLKTGVRQQALKQGSPDLRNRLPQEALARRFEASARKFSAGSVPRPSSRLCRAQGSIDCDR